MDFKLAAKYDWRFILFLLVGTTPTICKGHINHDSLKYSSEEQRIINSNQARYCVDDACSSINGEKDVFQETNISKEFSGQDISSSRIYAIWSTLIISAAPFFLLYYIPLDNSEAMRPRLNVILAFASGSLLGDAFLHLIPHASHVHKDNHHSHETNTDASNLDQMSIGLGVLSGIITFLGVEKLVRLVKCHHSHSHCKEILKKNLSKGGVKSNKNTQKSHNGKNIGDVDISAYLNLVADFAHNFTDGLSIGASYLAGKSIGILTTVTILLHEIPHEIGDFAILVKSGCSKRKAIWLQLLTALGSIAGTALAFHGAGDDGNISLWVLPFTAGGFIYIATVSVLPEILEDSTKLTQSIKEISALLCGVTLMVFIANME